jgi:tetratricopeptide (TPR) repeat protein
VHPSINDQKLLAKRRRKRIVILEIVTVIVLLASIEVYFDLLDRLGFISHDLGYDRAAETLFRQGLFVQERVRGKDNPELIGLLNGIAYFYYDSDQGEKALPLIQRSEAICDAKFGPKDPRCAWTASCKSLIDGYIGNFVEAERGLALEGQSRFPEAESAFLQALATREALYGQNSESLLPVLNNLTRVYTKERKDREAAATRRRAADISANRNPRG